ncbi:MAG TPA: cytochrome c-type biogenesis protein CcmH [Thermoanaerobaculia bacterium]|nr:cytochrome c-type biogenesis protein CcmH [Thermoanaerobaculia bacterium]
MIATLFLLAMMQIKAPDAEQFVGAPQGKPLAGPQLERRAMEISSELRCPVCQGLAIGDSPSQMASNMKEQVRELLARGYTEPQILSYFEKSYGQFVLLKPKFQGVNTLVWILPVLALAAGFALVVTKAKKLETAPEKVTVAAEEPADDPYLARVREMVEKP